MQVYLILTTLTVQSVPANKKKCNSGLKFNNKISYLLIMNLIQCAWLCYNIGHIGTMLTHDKTFISLPFSTLW